MKNPILCFIGGGNMAQAVIGGQIRAGYAPASIWVVDPNEAQRENLERRWGVRTFSEAGANLQQVAIAVWAVKPQLFATAAAACGPHLAQALHVSVMAGIPSDAIKRQTGAERVVRTMPNTPALIGQGITGVFADGAVSEAQRQQVQALLAPTGQLLWVAQEADLDAVTALAGSGPAYVFYFIEAMVQAAQEMGLTPAQGKQLALATFAGATALAQASEETPQTLRERVTSKGGTTHAAISSMESSGIKPAFERALHAARDRARAMGQEFGSN